MFDFFNYERPGKGVQKRDPNQSRITLYFELLFRKSWDLCKVNLIYVLLTIPLFIGTMCVMGVVTSDLTDSLATVIANIMGLDSLNPQYYIAILGMDLGLRVVFSTLFMVFLGMGPVTAGVTYVVRNYGNEEHVWLWSDIWKNIKNSFKQSILLWIMDLFFFVNLVFAFKFYNGIGGLGNIALYLLSVVSLLYLMMHIYVYQIMITFKISFGNIIKHSIILALMTAPKILLMLAILLVVHMGIPLLIIMIGKNSIAIGIFILLEILFLPAASAFTTNFFTCTVVKELIKSI